jgi:hypothetical protein
VDLYILDDYLRGEYLLEADPPGGQKIKRRTVADNNPGSVRFAILVKSRTLLSRSTNLSIDFRPTACLATKTTTAFRSPCSLKACTYSGSGTGFSWSKTTNPLESLRLSNG